MVNNTKSIILLTTYDCNLRCSYCYEPKKRKKYLTFSRAKSIIETAMHEAKMDGYEMLDLQFMGGEPLMVFGLIRNICEWLWSRDNELALKSLSITTNGTLLTPEMKEWFKENKQKIGLSLSFDGDRLMQNVNRCGSSKNIDLDYFLTNFPDNGVKMTVAPATIGYFSHGVEYLHNVGFKVVEANLAMGEVGWKREHLEVLKRELNELCNFYLANPSIRRMSFLNIPLANLLFTDAPDMQCVCGKNVVCYDCDGEMYACHMFSPITLPEVKAKESQHIDFDAVRKDGYSPCSLCMLRKLCTRCFGVNYKERGDCNMQSEFDCAQFKLFFLANCKLQRQIAVRDNNEDMVRVIDRVVRLYAESLMKQQKIS